MKKLLHERLRESECWGDLFSPIEILNASFRVLFDKLADEIERYYKPLPRFDDGEPMDIDIETNLGRIDSLIWNGKGWILENDFCNQYSCENARHPTPKVLDADGVEIKVGDAVWCINTGQMTHTVLEISENGYISTNIWKFQNPENFTHKEPDSLQKLLNDMRKNPDEWINAHNKWLEMTDRLECLIERVS